MGRGAKDPRLCICRCRPGKGLNYRAGKAKGAGNLKSRANASTATKSAQRAKKQQGDSMRGRRPEEG